jgi:hypothetical protein
VKESDVALLPGVGSTETGAEYRDFTIEYKSDSIDNRI